MEDPKVNSIYSSWTLAAGPAPRRWRTVATSALLHSAVIVLIAYVGRVAGVVPETASRSLTFVQVIPPDLPRPMPQPVRLPPVAKEIMKPEPLPVPEIEKPPEPERVVARVEPIRPPEPRREDPIPVERPKPPVVQVGGFAAAEPSARSVQQARPVQQAAFDTVEGRASGPKVASALLGTFEQPASAGGRGKLSGVADAGFGTGVAAGPGGGGGRVVTAGGFDAGAGGGSGAGARAPAVVKATDFDQRVAQSVARTPRAAPTELPVEILSKPTPEYTDEARALKIEGEVTLEVEFAATGEIRVVRVVRSLGHGLDERAARAVLGMRFRPARHDGQPVDVRTTVSIVFRLA